MLDVKFKIYYGGNTGECNNCFGRKCFEVNLYKILNGLLMNYN